MDEDTKILILSIISAVLLFVGLVLYGLADNEWQSIGGAILLMLAWILARESAEMLGKRRGKLEERAKIEREQG
jgi:hypothetical protein